MSTLRKRNNGPAVAVTLIVICLAGFVATIWNYSRTHPFSTSGTLVQSGQNPLVQATFNHPAPNPGQRIVLSIAGDSVPARGGSVLEKTGNSSVLIAVDTPVDAETGAKVTASVDGTVAPSPPAVVQ
jgi:hypothetical protein